MEIQYFYKTKQEVAIHQLDRAIDLFTQEQDIICATTLAGASEEICGKLLEEIGGQSWLKEHIDLCLDLLGHAGHPEIKEKDIANERNQLRNNLKHLCDGEDVLVINFEAKEMIDRAINNMLKLGIPPSKKIDVFISTFWK